MDEIRNCTKMVNTNVWRKGKGERIGGGGSGGWL